MRLKNLLLEQLMAVKSHFLTQKVIKMVIKVIKNGYQSYQTAFKKPRKYAGFSISEKGSNPFLATEKASKHAGLRAFFISWLSKTSRI